MSELVILFNPKNDEREVLPQLSKYMDKLQDKWSMVICSRMTWSRIEAELQPMVSARYNKVQVVGYDKLVALRDRAIPANEVPPGIKGFSALTYRGRPVVAISGDNIISARVGELDG